MGAWPDQSAGANIMSLQIYLVPRLFHVNKQAKACSKLWVFQFFARCIQMQTSVSLYYIIHVCCMCMGLCVIFFSVWPFKRFLQGRGGREDNGSRHYLLLSCRLSIRPHTVWPIPTRTPSRCTCTHAPTDAHMHLCRDKVRAHRAR